MYCHVDLPAALAQHELHGCPKPINHLIGQTEEGEWRTSCAKEYPELLNQSFAAAFQATLRQRCFVLRDQCVDTYGTQLAQLSARMDCSRIMPDYQPAQ